jgi:hypothetical protein
MTTTPPTRRLSTAATLAVVALGGLAGPRAPAAGAAGAPAPCAGGPPTEARSWRAFVPAGTPLRAGVAVPGPPAPITLLDRWLMVLDRRRDGQGRCFVEVRVPGRPNTAHAWVATARVTVTPTRWRIEVSRAARRATLLHGGRAVARWRVVVGKPATPTPAGLFALQASYRTSPGSFEGTWILALTAHSDVLRTFDGGDGQVALHGRGGASLADPLGTAASHGCVRFDNRAIGSIVRRIGRARLPGVPVAIR